MSELKLLMLLMIFSLCLLAFGVRAMKVNPERVAVTKLYETYIVSSWVRLG